ncbi:MAG: roadblock/LC7 domain-containing protein [Promethearchaeota archaeon]
MMSELTAEEAQNLAMYLAGVTEHTELEALALVTREGIRLAFSAIPGYEINPDLLASMSAAILQAGENAVERLGYTNFMEVVMRGPSAFLLLSAAGRFFLIGASRTIKDLGKTVSVFRYYSKEIGKSYPIID